MGTIEADSEQKGPIMRLTQLIDGPGGHQVIVELIFSVHLRPKIPQGVQFGWSVRLDDGIQVIALPGSWSDDLEVVRGNSRGVVDLTGSKRFVAIFSEVARHTNKLTPQLFRTSSVYFIVVKARRGRPPAKHHTGPGRIADRRLAMGIGEKDAPFCQPVDIWRAGVGVPSEAAHPIIEVVDSDQQNIRCLISVLLCA